MQQHSIGFVGTGTIGGPIALRLLKHRHPLSVFDTKLAATRAAQESGANVATTLQALADSDVIFLSLPGPKEIDSVMQGATGLLKHLKAGAIVVDLSTNSVALNRAIAEAAAARNIRYLDAPVSGGKVAAHKGSLSVMVGGERAAFDTVRTLLECFAEHIFYMGDAGAGTMTKLVNNQIFLCASVLIQEGFVMGAKAGMDPNALLEVLNVSSAGSLLNRASLVLSRKFDLDVFALSIATKDVSVALDSGTALGASMPLTEAALKVYQQAMDLGIGHEDFFATVKVLEAAAGTELPALEKPAK